MMACSVFSWIKKVQEKARSNWYWVFSPRCSTTAPLMSIWPLTSPAGPLRCEPRTTWYIGPAPSGHHKASQIARCIIRLLWAKLETQQSEAKRRAFMLAVSPQDRSQTIQHRSSRAYRLRYHRAIESDAWKLRYPLPFVLGKRTGKMWGRGSSWNIRN